MKEEVRYDKFHIFQPYVVQFPYILECLRTPGKENINSQHSELSKQETTNVNVGTKKRREEISHSK